MHSEQSPQKQQNGGNGPAGRKVRSLLGLPESGTGRLHGQAPVPPGAFRYQRQSGLPAPFPPSPMSEQPSAPDMMDREEQTPPVMAPGDSPQVDHQAADDAQSPPQPPAQGGARPLTVPAAAQAHQLSNEKTGQQAQRRPPASMLPDQVPVMSAAADGTEEPGQPPPDNRQEMAIPGRSTVRQVFTALTAAADGEKLPAPDQPPTMAQHAAPLPAGQARLAHPAMEHGERSAPLPPADRSRPAAKPLPAAGQAMGLASREETTATMTAAQATDPATERRSNLRRDTADKIVEPAGKAETPATIPERKANIAPRQQREHPPVQAQPGGEERPAPATPARRPDADGARQIEELRRTFYELVSKKNMTTDTKDREQTTTAEAQPPPQPPLQQIVVINRTSGSRSRGREPYAFWERSCMARTTLKMIR